MTLKNLIELQEKATPGEWSWDGPVWNYDPEQEAPWITSDYIPEGRRTESVVLYGTIKCQKQEDAEFIIAACNFDFAALDRRMKALENLAETVIYDNSDIGLVEAARKALGS